MCRPLLRSLTWFLPLLVAFSAAGLAADDPKPIPIPKGEVAKYTFDQSKVFPGTVRDYWVYVPRQYDPAKPACVHVNQDGIQFNAPAVFDELIHKKEMPVTIGIFITPGKVKATSPDALDRFNRSYEYDGLGDAYARFLLDEFLPEVEKKTTADGRPIRLSKDGNDRSIGGSSSGAICAFTAAWERPDAFRRVFSAVGTYVGLRGGNVYPTLIRKYEPKPLRIFLEDGSGDLNIYGGDWWMANYQEMERALTFAGYEVNHAWGTGGHNGQHATEVFPEAMRWLWKDWPAPIKVGGGSQQLREILLPGEGWQEVAGSHKYAGLAANAKGEVFFIGEAKFHKFGLDGKVNPAVIDCHGDWFAFGPDGRLWSIDALGHVRSNDTDGKELNRPNFDVTYSVRADLVIRHDGGVYAVCPPIRGPGGGKVLCFSPKGEKRVVDTGLKYPSGVTLSTDQSLLYVADGASRWVYSYQIRPDGTLAYMQKYYHLHIPDTADGSDAAGMRVDRDGRLYVATNLGIQVCDQAGRVNCIMPTPHGRAFALTFGGEDFSTLFVISGDRVYKRKLKVKGANAFQVPIKPAQPRL